MMKVTEKEEDPCTGFDSSDDEEGCEVDTSPFPTDWLDFSSYGCAAQLGISGLPGCRFKNTWRSLDADIATLKSHDVKAVFTLCSQGELSLYRAPQLLQKLAEEEILVHHSHFADGGTPKLEDLIKMVDDIKVNLMQGRKTLVHCYGGLGRSCLVAASVLMVLDPSMCSEAAIQKLRDLRGPAAIQSVKQYNFVNDFRKNIEDIGVNEETTSRSISR